MRAFVAAQPRWVLPVLPVAALLVAATLTLPPFSAADPVRAGQDPDGPRVIEVTASRFAFEPSTIEVGVGERVRLVLKSADGVHGLEIKKFDVKQEIPRGGAPVTVEFTAKTAGSFPVLCSEYCGKGHEDMTGTLVVRAAGQAQ